MSGLGAGELPTDDSNLAVRAAQLIKQRYGLTLGLKMHIHKEIPIAGGMAGGSADAAAALLAANELWQLQLSQAQLMELAGELGSDIPFAVLGGTALGKGRGERLVPLSCPNRYRWVIALANQKLSTPKVFAKYDEMLAAGSAQACLDNPSKLISLLADGAPAGEIAGLLANSLQAPAIEIWPALRKILTTGEAAGALRGIVSGSGPTCIFLCPDGQIANQVCDALARLAAVADIAQADAPAEKPQFIQIGEGEFEPS